MGNGLRELQTALRQLPVNIQKNVAVGATRASCKPILEKARANAPYEYGDLEKSIKISKAKSKRGQRHIVHFRVSAGNFVNTTEGKEKIFYAAFNEWGYTKPNGSHVMAHPFMRPALETEAHKSIEYAKAYYAKRIPEEIEKLRRRG